MNSGHEPQVLPEGFRWIRRPAQEAARRADVTIVVPAYNAEPYIGEALSSLLSQTHRDLIVHVHDDGSQDGTLAAAIRLADERCLVTTGPNRGLSASRNLGTILCRTPFLGFMDADDLSRRTRVDEQLGVLQAHPEVGVMSGCMRRFGPGSSDQQPDPTARSCAQSPAYLLYGVALDVSASMGRTEVLERFPFDESVSMVEDYDWLCRMALDGVKLLRTSDIHVDYRRHSASLSADSEEVIAHSNRVRLRYHRRTLTGPGVERFRAWMDWAAVESVPAIRDVRVMDTSLYLALASVRDGYVRSTTIDESEILNLTHEIARRQFERRAGLASAGSLPLVARELGLREALVGFKRGLSAGRGWSARRRIDLQVDWFDYLEKTVDG